MAINNGRNSSFDVCGVSMRNASRSKMSFRFMKATTYSISKKNNHHGNCRRHHWCAIVGVVLLLSFVEQGKSFSAVTGVDTSICHRRVALGDSRTRHRVALSGGVGMMGRVEHVVDCGHRLQQPHQALLVMGMTATQDEEEDDYSDGDNYGDDNNNLGGTSDFGEEDLETAGVVLGDLSWRLEKLRLEEANTRRFLKAKPRFLPYDECRKWVQAFGRWKSEEDWVSWIAMGEKRNSYIPSQPDKYYGRLGVWISWEHFLGVEETNQSSQ